MPGVDLHTHTTASDGTLEPAELVALAKEQGLEALAVTDHDTVAGLPEAMAKGRELDLEVVPGCELSAKTPEGELHILGLWLPERPQTLIQTMDELMRYRHDRNHIIIGMLQDLGLDVDYAQVQEIAGEGSVGRPHIARLLLDKGYVNSVQDAFDRYLGANGKAYAPKKILSPRDAVTLLKEEQATVILAHPKLLGKSMDEIESLVMEMKPWGLDGLEAYYSEQSPSETRGLLNIAERHELAVSGGSDFHGSVKPKIRLGTGKGNLHIPYSVVEALKARRREQGLPV
jgi:hypothetical protein